VIYKSTSSVRSIVQMLDATRMYELERIRYLPTQFQAFVPGTNIRVHVVGSALFATEIQTEAVDYRYAGRDGLTIEMAPTVLPTAVAERCYRLAQLLQLPLCGIDLKRRPDGAYYCFEVNPSPGYSYYQEQTGQNIAEAIVHYLR
jgi:glutathione synthase/RimK-type ligase-like ATP-grasp enzyme